MFKRISNRYLDSKEMLCDNCNHYYNEIIDKVFNSKKRKIAVILLITLIASLFSFALFSNAIKSVDYTQADALSNKAILDQLKNGTYGKLSSSEKKIVDGALSSGLGKVTGQSVKTSVTEAEKGYEYLVADKTGKIPIKTVADSHKATWKNGSAKERTTYTNDVKKAVENGKDSKTTEKLAKESTESDHYSLVADILGSIFKWVLKEFINPLCKTAFGDFLKTFKIGSTAFSDVFNNVGLGSSYTQYGGFVDVLYRAFFYVGWAVFIIIALFSIVSVLFSGFTDSTVEPFKIAGRMIITGFLLLNSGTIMNYIIGWAKKVQNLFCSIVGGEPTFKNIEGLESQITAEGVLQTIISIFVVIMILKEVVSLVLEIIERYFVYNLMLLFSPVAMSTMVNPNTAKVFWTYIKSFITHLFIMSLNYVFLGMATSLISNKVDIQGLTGTSGWAIGFIFIVAVLRIGQRIDNYLASMGFSVAQTGGNLASCGASAFMGMRAGMRALKTGVSVASKGTKAGASLMVNPEKRGTLKGNIGRATDTAKRMFSSSKNGMSANSKGLNADGVLKGNMAHGEPLNSKNINNATGKAMEGINSRRKSLRDSLGRDKYHNMALENGAKHLAQKGKSSPLTKGAMDFDTANDKGLKVKGSPLASMMKSETSLSQNAKGLSMDTENGIYNGSTGQGRIPMLNSKGEVRGAYNIYSASSPQALHNSSALDIGNNMVAIPDDKLIDYHKNGLQEINGQFVERNDYKFSPKTKEVVNEVKETIKPVKTTRKVKKRKRK